MKDNFKIPYFFDKSRSGFSDTDFEIVSPEKFHFTNSKLVEDLQNNFFLYTNKEKDGIKFYFINKLVTNKEDLQEIHLRIFSEDKADFYVVKGQKNNKETYIIVYARTIPKEIKTIVEFFENLEDEELLQRINKTSIDTGAFWIYYKDVIKNVKIANVRNELVKILDELRDNLKNEINDDNCVQALIDRTLFIKFLEDRHIINSYFYGQNIEYKKILEEKSPQKVNDLFTKVHRIFENCLFDDPKIPNHLLTNNVLQIIHDTISGVKQSQLTLFDLKFDIIPIESISQIYEIFFSEEKRKKGIYYTPKQLTNFITEKTINQRGEVIDPACGSGAFLISAYKRLLKLEAKQFNSVKEKIDYRINLIKQCIYGIEKETIARRLTIFSLYLSVLDDLSIDENNEIKNLLREENNYPLFTKKIGENILDSNTFKVNKFDDKKFDFVVGNPPWKKDFTDEDAKKYLDDNKDAFSGKSELSQLFLHKAKNWEKGCTRYGFVVNTSNFTNEYGKFQDFFYTNFNIEEFYEVSDLELFTASEPAIVCIYTGNKQENNRLRLNVPKANEFTKLFKSILIIEDDTVEIEQNSLIKTTKQDNIPLRNFLIGNIGDFNIVDYLESNRFEKFENYILRDEVGEYFIRQGVKVYSKEVLSKVFSVDVKQLSQTEVVNLEKEFKQGYTSFDKTDKFCYLYIKPNNILKFTFNNNKVDLYLSDNISMMHRARSPQINEGARIIFPNHGTQFKAVFVNDFSLKFYPSADLNVLKLVNNDYCFFTAILNSNLIEYYLKIKYWNRLSKGHSRINQYPILQIPIPKNKNLEIVKEIEKLSQQITEVKVKFTDKEEELNNLIFKLYGIGILEKQRINDFFIKDTEKVSREDLENYVAEFSEYISDALKTDTEIVADIYEEKNLVKGICVVKIYFGKKGESYPKSKKVSRYFLTELLKNVSKTNILTLRERIYGENTIYIMKDNLRKSWTLTKAGEDAISEINKINKHKSKKK